MTARVLTLDRESRLWTLIAAGACLLPLLLQMPNWLAATLSVVGVLVAAASWRRALPLLVRVLLPVALVGVILAAFHFTVGRDTACALLASMLAIKPTETSTLRDGRSLLGFALFAPFATFLLDQGPLSLLLGLLGAVLALAALLRLTELESGDGRHPRTAWQRLAAVGKLTAVGLPLALVAFWLFPRLSTPLWGVPQRDVARTGLSDHMSPGEWVDLLSDDSTALRVQFFGAAPAPDLRYWRGPVLWNFDGRTWTQLAGLQHVAPAPARSGKARWDYEIELEPTDGHQLVALDLPISAPQGAQLSQDYGLYSEQPLSSVTRWTLHSAAPIAFEPRLPAALRTLALALPPGYNPRTVALAQQWRHALGTDDNALIQRALRMYHDHFAYTLATPLLGRNSVDEFLFEQKAGYCEHFSSSFVVLMRAAGIPARVVTGYAGGYHNPVGNYWQVRRSDAHAWAEVWLDGRGWTRVDPTAAVAPDHVYDTVSSRAPGSNGLLGDWLPTPVFNIGDWVRRGWNDFALGFNAERQHQLLHAIGIAEDDSGRLVALFSTLSALALLWMVWLSARAERERDLVVRAWRGLGARYARLGLGRNLHEPATQWAERVSSARPRSAAELRELSLRFNNWRYAGGQTGREGVQLARALRRHRPRR